MSEDGVTQEPQDLEGVAAGIKLLTGTIVEMSKSMQAQGKILATLVNDNKAQEDKIDALSRAKSKTRRSAKSSTRGRIVDGTLSSEMENNDDFGNSSGGDRSPDKRARRDDSRRRAEKMDTMDWKHSGDFAKERDSDQLGGILIGSNKRTCLIDPKVQTTNTLLYKRDAREPRAKINDNNNGYEHGRGKSRGAPRIGDQEKHDIIWGTALCAQCAHEIAPNEEIVSCVECKVSRRPLITRSILCSSCSTDAVILSTHFGSNSHEDERICLRCTATMGRAEASKLSNAFAAGSGLSQQLVPEILSELPWIVTLANTEPAGLIRGLKRIKKPNFIGNAPTESLDAASLLAVAQVQHLIGANSNSRSSSRFSNNSNDLKSLSLIDEASFKLTQRGIPRYTWRELLLPSAGGSLSKTTEFLRKVRTQGRNGNFEEASTVTALCLEREFIVAKFRSCT